MAILKRKERNNYNQFDYGTFNIEQIKKTIEDVEKVSGNSVEPYKTENFYEIVHDENLEKESEEMDEKSTQLTTAAYEYLNSAYTKKPRYTQEELTQMLGLMEKFKDKNFSKSDLEEMIQKEKDKVFNIDLINPELTLNTRADVMRLRGEDFFSYTNSGSNIPEILLNGRGGRFPDDEVFKKYGIDKELTIDEKAKLMIQLERQTKDRINILKRRNEILESSQEYTQIKAEIEKLQNMQVPPEQIRELNDKVNMLRYKASSMCRLAMVQATVDVMSNNRDLYENFDLEKPNIKSTLNINDYTLEETRSEMLKMKQQGIEIRENAKFTDDTPFALGFPQIVLAQEEKGKNEFRESLVVDEEELIKKPQIKDDNQRNKELNVEEEMEL